MEESLKELEKLFSKIIAKHNKEYNRDSEEFVKAFGVTFFAYYQPGNSNYKSLSINDVEFTFGEYPTKFSFRDTMNLNKDYIDNLILKYQTILNIL